jgi:cell division inhibitor SepF
MASWWRQAMLYLGLGPDEEYEDFETSGSAGVPEPAPPVGAPEPRAAPVTTGPEPQPEPALSAVRPIRDAEPDPVAPSSPEPEPAAVVGERSVRAIPISNAKPHVVLPTSFNEAQEVGDRFKNNQPVIINLQAVDRDLARRLIDFASGLCYGIGGQMERVAMDVYLLTPADVEVSDEERQRLSERGLHDG